MTNFGRESKVGDKRAREFIDNFASEAVSEALQSPLA
jgi:hypothetical protein